LCTNRRLDVEKTRIEGVLNRETIPLGKLLGENPNSFEQITNVVDVTNLALNHADVGESPFQDILLGTREFVSNLRNSSTKYSESLILRDAERYDSGHRERVGDERRTAYRSAGMAV